ADEVMGTATGDGTVDVRFDVEVGGHDGVGKRARAPRVEAAARVAADGAVVDRQRAVIVDAAAAVVVDAAAGRGSRIAAEGGVLHHGPRAVIRVVDAAAAGVI